MQPADLLERRKTHFTFWRTNGNPNPPHLVIGTFEAGIPNTVKTLLDAQLQVAASDPPGLFSLPASSTGLADGIYHYWFTVEDTHPQAPQGQTINVTDPFATTVDWRVGSSGPTVGLVRADDVQPPAVIRLSQGILSPVDAGGESSSFPNDPKPDTLPTNNHLVIYELPTAWSNAQGTGSHERAVGTFKDVLALVDENAVGANFAGLDALRAGRSYLKELGVNALELLPPADSFRPRTWGYDTAHFLAPDWELGFPEGQAASTSNFDLAALVEACHDHGMRFFIDVVMAFGKNEAYEWIDHDHFNIDIDGNNPDFADPDTHDSRGGVRNGFGSTLFRYTRPLPGAMYDPMSGGTTQDAPARALMYTYVTRWMRDFRVDGIRMDSVENVANWDFIQQFKDRARALFHERWQAAGFGPAGADERFLAVGEELNIPLALLQQGRLDGLWNEPFQQCVRAAVLGEAKDGLSFEDTIRHMIDCRNFGFTDCAQAINYITSHDVEGFRKERLFTMLGRIPNLAETDIQKRIQLAFVCLLTANGVPMILAGEEFADQNDLFDQNGNVTDNGGKEVDPVDFSRLETDPIRQAIFQYVAGLVHFRTSQPALSVNDTNFIHVDLNDNKRVLAWVRGGAEQDPVVVLANFSDFTTAGALTDPGAEYVVHNWPATPAGRHWREVTQNRNVDPAQVGREPVFSWEAKVYTLA
jgi:pullulanase